MFSASCHLFCFEAPRAKEKEKDLSLSSWKALIYKVLLVEISVKQTLERLAVSGLIPGHFMYGVVDGERGFQPFGLHPRGSDLRGTCEKAL